MRVDERFLKYTLFFTASNEHSDTSPSNQYEFELAYQLKEELQTIGLVDVIVTNYCYVYGRLPATKGMENKKAIGFIAHLDTSPDFSAVNVTPQVIKNYDGGDVSLKGGNLILKPSDFPDLKNAKGKTLITTDGTTLLGADDKAGIAEIITALQEVVEEEIPHGDIWVGFTPDEEIGLGAEVFDLGYFKADYAYTVDGDYEGEIAYDNFNAANAFFHIKGVSVHPGEAKDIMINASLVASEIACALPCDQTPATTSGREGFYHLVKMSGDVSEARLSYIVRDHDRGKFMEKLKFLDSIAASFNEKYGKGVVSLDIYQSYENMLTVMEKNMYIIDSAKDAIRSCGIEPVSRPVRGGTDGARLSFLGLPCPNLGTGGYGFHGPYEHITVEAMETVVKILKHIIANPVNR